MDTNADDKWRQKEGELQSLFKETKSAARLDNQKLNLGGKKI